MSSLDLVRYLSAKDAYYNSAPIMSDTEFDLLEAKLVASGKLDGKALPVRAPIQGEECPLPQYCGGLDKIVDANVGQLDEWMGGATCIMSEKADGISVIAKFVGGKLVQALTLGDGHMGEDITANVAKMKGIPVRTPALPRGEVIIRGEIVVLKADMEEHFPDAKNTRNCAAGVARRHSGEGAEYLTVLAFEIMGDTHFRPHQQMEELQKWGFQTPKFWVSDFHAVIDRYIAGEREALPYDIDGFVIKHDEPPFERVASGNPTDAVALKFKNQGALAPIKRVMWQAGLTGKVTPVAHFAPVEVVGVTIRKATLHNWERFTSMKLRSGHRVYVERCGDVIPGVAYNQDIDLTEEGIPFVSPKSCPSCENELIHVGTPSGTALHCLYVNCPAKVVGRAKRWLAALDVKGWGDKTLHCFVEDGHIKNPLDLYRMSEDFLAGHKIGGRTLGQRGRKMFINLQKGTSKITLAKFIRGLAIPHFGKASSVDVADACSNGISDFIFGNFPQNKGAMFASHSVFFQNPPDYFKGLLDVFTTNYSKEAVPEKAEGDLSGQVYCFSEIRDSGLEHNLKARGGEVKGGISKKVTCLIVRDNKVNTTKVQKARKYDIRIVTMEDFLSEVNENGSGRRATGKIPTGWS